MKQVCGTIKAEMSLKILSLNTRGISDVLKRRAIFNFYRNKAAIICLQETHSTAENELIWSSEWGGDILFSHGTTKSRGVCILMPKGMKQTCSDVYRDNAGRIIKTNIEINNCAVSICNIYAPNDDNPAFFNEVHKVLSNASSNKILVGDFNLVMNLAMDRIGVQRDKYKAKEI